MYDLINQFAQTVVGTIPPEHVTDYEWLLQNVGQASTPDYQRRYRRFWAMNAAQLSPAFYTTYFGTLTAAMSHSPTLNSIAQTLHASSARQNGQKSLQFSFATKLLHMTNPHSPIYDSQVAAFYFFQEPLTDLQQRINGLVAFHGFLTQEYARVLNGGLLASAIQEFRLRLNPQHFTDEKIVDSLIWAFVALLRKGALSAGQVTYR
ncbi:MAG: hypothetical protein LAP86_34915 [Acidobacteriia bacterium]|nr:hypothetical protein [Terriglobia bacterium]